MPKIDDLKKAVKNSRLRDSSMREVLKAFEKCNKTKMGVEESVSADGGLDPLSKKAYAPLKHRTWFDTSLSEVQKKAELAKIVEKIQKKYHIKHPENRKEMPIEPFSEDEDKKEKMHKEEQNKKALMQKNTEKASQLKQLEQALTENARKVREHAGNVREIAGQIREIKKEVLEQIKGKKTSMVNYVSNQLLLPSIVRKPQIYALNLENNNKNPFTH